MVVWESTAVKMFLYIALYKGVDLLYSEFFCAQTNLHAIWVLLYTQFFVKLHLTAENESIQNCVWSCFFPIYPYIPEKHWFFWTFWLFATFGGKNEKIHFSDFQIFSFFSQKNQNFQKNSTKKKHVRTFFFGNFFSMIKKYFWSNVFFCKRSQYQLSNAHKHAF